MQTHVKAHWTKLSILSLLLFVWGALLPAYACSPEVDNAVARLQKNARAEIRAKDWLAQITSKMVFSYDATSTESITEQESKKGLRAAFIAGQLSPVYIKQYLAEVEIRQNTHGEWEAPRKFQITEEVSYTYHYIYPSRASDNESPESACRLEIIAIRASEEEDMGFVVETGFYYIFEIEDGEMRLMDVHVAG